MDYRIISLFGDSETIVELSEIEYQKIKDAHEILYESLYIEEKYDLVIENYMDLEKSLLEITTNQMVLWGHGYNRFHKDTFLINRRLVNILTATRMYADHVKHHVTNVFRVAGELKPDIDCMFSHQYDTRLGYRAMEALRNYVQHRSFPVHKLSFDNSWVDKRTKMRFTITPSLKTEELSSDGKFNKTVLHELEAIGEEVDIKMLIRDYIEGIWMIHEEIRKLLNIRTSLCEKVFDKTVEGFKSHNPNEILKSLPSAVTCDENGRCIDVIHLDKQPVEYRRHLEQKNGSLVNLNKRYVTSQIIN